MQVVLILWYYCTNIESMLFLREIINYKFFTNPSFTSFLSFCTLQCKNTYKTSDKKSLNRKVNDRDKRQVKLLILLKVLLRLSKIENVQFLITILLYSSSLSLLIKYLVKYALESKAVSLQEFNVVFTILELWLYENYIRYFNQSTIHCSCKDKRFINKSSK